MVDGVETWSECPSFTLTKRTSHTLVATLRCIANLTDDLLNENYDYVCTSRFQSDPTERLFSKYMQMSGGYFLENLREVNNSEKILSLNSIIEADLYFWEENIYAENTTDSVTSELHTRLNEMTNKRVMWQR